MKQGFNFVPIALGLVVVGGLGIGGLYVWQNQQDAATVSATSDTTNIAANINVCGDPWIGYMPLASDTLQHELRRNDVVFTFENDGGLYEERLARLREGGTSLGKDGCDLAVATVDANLLNTPDFNRGGVILAVLDQSSGGDAMVCNTDAISSIDHFSQRQGWTVAFTPDSPSHQLLRAIGNDFGVDDFLQDGPWRIESDGSEAALASLQNGQASCAVLWEPDVTRALQNEDFEVLYSSSDADKLIVDVLLAHRPHMAPASEMRPFMELVVRNYFSALRTIREDEALLLSEAQSYVRAYAGARLSDEEVLTMLEGVTWVNLRENGESWFGVSDNPYYGLAEAHEQALRIIRADAAHGSGFLPFFHDPSMIMDSRIIRTLYEEGVIGELNRTVTNPLQLRFPALSELGWNTLETQGALRSRRIVFQSGSLVLEDFSRNAIGEAMQDFRRYPGSRLEIQIGYQTVGDVQSNIANATSRASVVRDYLVETYDIDPNRVRVYVPDQIDLPTVIPQFDGEGGRAYRSRLREVRLVLRRTNENET